MGHSKNKVGVIQFTVLTIVSMTDGIIMIPTLAAGVGAISLYAWVTTTLGAVILAYAFAKCGQFNKKTGGLGGYAEYGFGKAGNFLANYTYAISLMIANVGIAIFVVSYASSFFNVQLSTMQVIMYSYTYCSGGSWRNLFFCENEFSFDDVSDGTGADYQYCRISLFLTGYFFSSMESASLYFGADCWLIQFLYALGFSWTGISLFQYGTCKKSGAQCTDCSHCGYRGHWYIFHSVYYGDTGNSP